MLWMVRYIWICLPINSAKLFVYNTRPERKTWKSPEWTKQSPEHPWSPPNSNIHSSTNSQIDPTPRNPSLYTTLQTYRGSTGANRRRASRLCPHSNTNLSLCLPDRNNKTPSRVHASAINPRPSREPTYTCTPARRVIVPAVVSTVALGVSIRAGADHSASRAN